MFIFNLKINKNLVSKILFILMLIIIIAIFIFCVYIIFIKDSDTTKLSDTVKGDDIFEVDESNYANILKASSEDLDSYIGCKVHIVGYVYRLLDFEENQFVIARDMSISENSQTLIVGFLCEYENATDFEDGTWIDIVGEITKGYFNGDIAILNILSIEECEEPENPIVSMPDDTYIPTANMF